MKANMLSRNACSQPGIVLLVVGGRIPLVPVGASLFPGRVKLHRAKDFARPLKELNRQTFTNMPGLRKSLAHTRYIEASHA